MTCYITASAIATLPISWLSNKFGSRIIFAYSVFGFTIASILCGIATFIKQIVLFRLFQEIFGATLISLSQSTLLLINPSSKDAKAMALWGMIGPSLGGYLTNNYSWRWVFYINIPFGILAGLEILKFLPIQTTKTNEFNYIGFSLFALFIAIFQLFLDRGNDQNWLSSNEIKSYLVLMALSSWFFIIDLKSSNKPFICIEIFKDHNIFSRNYTIINYGFISAITTKFSQFSNHNCWFNYDAKRSSNYAGDEYGWKINSKRI